MNTQNSTIKKIELLKEQYIDIENKIKSLQESYNNIHVSDFLYSDDCDIVHELNVSLKNPLLSQLPSIKSALSELVRLINIQTVDFDKKETEFRTQVGILMQQQNVLITELASFFKPAYVIQFNKAYDSSGELLKEVAIVAEHFKEYKSAKKYSDKFVIFLDYPISVDTVLKIISEHLPNYDKNFKGKTSVEKLIVNFNNYHNFYLI